MKTWYVAFLKNHVTAMLIVKDRGAAIALACDMLERGIEVTGAGPMMGLAEQEIDPATIRQIWLQRLTDENGRAATGLRAIVS